MDNSCEILDKTLSLLGRKIATACQGHSLIDRT
jgi:hypothetical protein